MRLQCPRLWEKSVQIRSVDLTRLTTEISKIDCSAPLACMRQKANAAFSVICCTTSKSTIDAHNDKEHLRRMLPFAGAAHPCFQKRPSQGRVAAQSLLLISRTLRLWLDFWREDGRKRRCAVIQPHQSGRLQYEKAALTRVSVNWNGIPVVHGSRRERRQPLHGWLAGRLGERSREQRLKSMGSFCCCYCKELARVIGRHLIFPTRNRSGHD